MKKSNKETPTLLKGTWESKKDWKVTARGSNRHEIQGAM